MNTDIKNEMNEENEKKSENREKVKIMMYANFGEFISKKRVEKKITLRKMADMLGVSAPFLTDVEKDRRNRYRKTYPTRKDTEFVKRRKRTDA